jgi:hypothetical protein
MRYPGVTRFRACCLGKPLAISGWRNAQAVNPPSKDQRNMAGRVNTRNLITIVSVTILVGTEILGAALALGWALGGVFELPELWSRILIGLFLAGGASAMLKFFRHAASVEPIFDK